MDERYQNPSYEKPNARSRLSLLAHNLLRFVNIEVPASEDEKAAAEMLRRDVDRIAEQLIVLQEIAHGAATYMLDHTVSTAFSSRQVSDDNPASRSRIQQWNNAHATEISAFIETYYRSAHLSLDALVELHDAGWRLLAPLGYYQQ